MIGCNYQDSVHGTDMWKYYDHQVIEEDLKALSENGVTEHMINDDEAIIVAVNYDDKTHKTEFKVKDGFELETLYGDANEITKCNGAIYLAKRK